VTDRTVAVLVETPTNPLMRLTDLGAAAEVARGAGSAARRGQYVCDPFFQRPFEFGADIVWHSTTKYLNGHSDMIGGIAVVNDDDLAARLQFIQNAAGAVPGPFDCWLALRGTKTLHLRMPAHDRTAGRSRLARRSRRRGARDLPRAPLAPAVRARLPPDVRHGRHDHRRDGLERAGARRCSADVHVFSLAESLGGVESLISHPASMTHASVPPERRAELGITEG
jgi:cystathionine beta-lyase/cystathionine gamma-synthase